MASIICGGKRNLFLLTSSINNSGSSISITTISSLPLFLLSSSPTTHNHRRRRTMSSTSSASYKKVLTLDTINPNVKNVEYAVRGELSNRATKYSEMLSQGKGKENDLPFESVVSANIGNPQQQPYLAQKPLTFWRQVRFCFDMRRSQKGEMKKVKMNECY
jgi:alanine transaminase